MDRTKAPASYPLDSLEFTIPHFYSIKEKEDLLHIPYHQQPIQIFEWVFSCGRFEESVPGVSFFAAKLIGEGSKYKTSEELSAAFEYLGTFFEITPGVDYISVRLYCQKINWESSLRILQELLSEPRLSQDEFLILRNNRIENLRQQWAKPSQVVTLEFLSDLFGNNHPYGRPLTPDLVKEVTYNQTIQFIESTLFSQPRIVVVGDWNETMESVCKEILDSLTSVTTPSTKNSFRPVLSSKREIVWEGSTQASIRIGNISKGPSHPDIHRFTVANTLFGGFFGSRLMKKMREERGLTYGIYSSINHWKNASYWMISTEIQKDKVIEAREVINQTIFDLSHTEPRLEEVNILSGFLKGKILTSMDSVFSRASLYKTLWLQGLDLSTIQDYLQTVNTITPEQISKSLKQEIKETVEVIVA